MVPGYTHPEVYPPWYRLHTPWGIPYCEYPAYTRGIPYVCTRHTPVVYPRCVTYLAYTRGIPRCNVPGIHPWYTQVCNTLSIPGIPRCVTLSASRVYPSRFTVGHAPFCTGFIEDYGLFLLFR